MTILLDAPTATTLAERTLEALAMIANLERQRDEARSQCDVLREALSLALEETHRLKVKEHARKKALRMRRG